MPVSRELPVDFSDCSDANLLDLVCYLEPRVSKLSSTIVSGPSIFLTDKNGELTVPQGESHDLVDEFNLLSFAVSSAVNELHRRIRGMSISGMEVAAVSVSSIDPQLVTDQTRAATENLVRFILSDGDGYTLPLSRDQLFNAMNDESRMPSRDVA